MSNFTGEQVNNGKAIDGQQLAITTIDNNVAVSAGAGSGKTRVLVERFLHILEQGQTNGKEVAPKEILAITFTRKAAGEMKERVRSKMNEKITETNTDFWKKQLGELERAQITTIHGLCSRLLKENPVELGLDPAFNLAEEFEGAEFLQECLNDFVRQGLRTQNADLFTLTNAYGFKSTIDQLESLVGSIEDIIAFGDLTIPYKDGSDKILAEEPALKARLCTMIEELSEREVSAKGTASAIALLKENLTEVLDGIRKEPSNFSAYDTYVGDIKNPANVIKEELAKIRELKGKLLAFYVNNASILIVQAWQNVLQDFATYYRARKEQEDFLTFDDLEELALNLLKENEQVRHKYQEKFRYIMVDEFQDTNDRQKQIIYLLCGDDADKLHGRKLFVVGDPKQSIYRFRGADVSVFAEVRRAIAELGGENISLSKNFRSKESIVNACNHVFKTLLGEDSTKDIFFEEVEIGKEDKQAGGELPEILEIPYDDSTKDIKRELEAAKIAEHIKKLHAESKVPYDKVAILLSAMTACDKVTEALGNYGVPFIVVDGKGFYERQEVLDFLNLLTVLQNRRRSLELAGVLRSPYFGFDDELITKMFLQVNEEQSCLWEVLMNLDASSLNGEQACLVTHAQESLKKLSEYADLLALSELLQKIKQVLNLEAILYLQDNGAAKFANVKKLIGLGQEYCTAKQGTLASWLEHVADLRKAQARETAANLPATDAVQIMTIHKSKGLQFDTVYLPMLDRRGANDTTTIKFHKEFGLGIKALLADGNLHESNVLLEIKGVDKELEKAEKQRQLYVAMTRAENRLILSGVYDENAKASSSDNWFTNLRKILGGSDKAKTYKPEEVDMRGKVLKAVDLSGETESVVPDEELLALLSTFAASGKNYFSPTALQTYLYCQRQYFYQQEGLPALEVGGEGGSSLPPQIVGSIIHKALEIYDDKDLDKAFTAAVEEYANGNLYVASKAKAMLEQYVVSDLYKTLPKDRLREMRFALPIEELSISGIIDCVVKTPDGLSIVDYKTGRPPKVGEVKLGYAYQLALYKYAAEKLLGEKINDAKLHFLQNLSEWNLPQDKDYFAEALELCKEISSKGEEKDFACNLASCAYCPYNYLCPQK